MKKVAVIVIFLPFLVVGCKTMQQQYASSLVGVTTAKDELLMLRQANVIDDEEWEEIYPWFLASTKFLEAMDSAYQNKQEDLFRTYYNAILQALFELETYSNKTKGEPAWPSIRLPSVR